MVEEDRGIKVINYLYFINIMKKVIRKMLGRFNFCFTAVFAIGIAGVLGLAGYVWAASTSEFQQVISAGTLAVDIVDGSYSSVASPAVALSTTTFSFACSTSTGTFGATTTEQIYVSNPDGADDGWTLTLAASDPTDVWDSAGTDFDFNEGGGNCADDGATTDAGDDLGGRMTVDPSGATLSVGSCSGCVVTNVSKGSEDYFDEGTTDSITLLTAAAGSDDIGDWRLNGVGVTQTIPAEQPAASDYTLSMVLTVTAS